MDSLISQSTNHYSSKCISFLGKHLQITHCFHPCSVCLSFSPSFPLQVHSCSASIAVTAWNQQQECESHHIMCSQVCMINTKQGPDHITLLHRAIRGQKRHRVPLISCISLSLEPHTISRSYMYNLFDTGASHSHRQTSSTCSRRPMRELLNYCEFIIFPR